MPERIQLSRRRGWRKPENTLVVARPTKWGNPFPIDEWGRERAVRLFANTARGTFVPRDVGSDDDNAISRAYSQHTAWLERLGAQPRELIRNQLAGKTLACWCPLDQPCHADVLLEIANGVAQ